MLESYLEIINHYIAVAIDIQRKAMGCKLPCLNQSFIYSIMLLGSVFLPVLLFVAAHLAVVRVYRVNQYVAMKFVFILLFVHILMTVGDTRIEGGIAQINYVLVKAVVLTLFVYNFFHLLNLRETGRRVRLITELSTSPLSRGSLEERYSIKELVDRRIDRLIVAGRIVEKDGILIEKNKGLFWADKILQAFKFIFFGKRSLDE